MAFGILSLSGAALLVAMTGPAPFEAVAPVSDQDLHGAAGRADLSMVATANSRSTVTGNAVNGNSVTGTIDIDEQAFSDMRGLSVVSANTGNNVSINASMVVNVAVRPES